MAKKHTYTFEALNDQGRPVKGNVKADSSDEAVHAIRSEGLFPTSIRKQSKTKAKKKEDLILSSGLRKTNTRQSPFRENSKNEPSGTLMQDILNMSSAPGNDIKNIRKGSKKGSAAVTELAARTLLIAMGLTLIPGALLVVVVGASGKVSAFGIFLLVIGCVFLHLYNKAYKRLFKVRGEVYEDKTVEEIKQLIKDKHASLASLTDVPHGLTIQQQSDIVDQMLVAYFDLTCLMSSLTNKEEPPSPEPEETPAPEPEANTDTEETKQEEQDEDAVAAEKG